MKNKSSSFASAVVYVYNCEQYIEDFLNILSLRLKESFSYSEIICVNDCSNDNSPRIVKEISKKISGISITLLNMSYHYGLEDSMSAGVDLSIGDFIYEFDTPVLDYEEILIDNVYEKTIEGYDIVSACPKNKTSFAANVFYSLLNKYNPNIGKLKTESFRLLSRRAINRIKNMTKTIPYRKAVYSGCGLKTYAIEYEPIHNIKRNNNNNKYRYELAINALIIFTDFGYHAALILSLIMLSVAGLTGVYGVFVYLTGKPIEGWTTTILFLSIAFFGLFVLLVIIIKYLQIITNLSFKHTNYNFESIEKLTK